MDVAEVPRINSIVLTGLDFSMNPDKVRYEAAQGFIRPFPEIKVMHQLKALAVMVYNQEKMTPFYHANVCDGRNSLAYFICAVHRQSAPQPKSHTRHSSTSSANSTSSSGSCKSAKKNCELPKLSTTSMLPLGYWDSLYYALVAEIQQLHQDLQNRFGFGCEMGTEPLHFTGPDGASNQPVTAIDLASMLETAWYALMDNRLVATLDDAVRMRKMREQAAKKLGDQDHTDGGEERPPIVYGLMDVNATKPEAIISLLWETHAPEIDRACCENFEDESMLTAYRAELHAKQIEEGLVASTPMSSNIPCKCHRACVCRLECDIGADHCTCQNRVQIYHLVHEQENTKAAIHSKYVKQDRNVPNPFLGAATNTLAQMQIAAMANPDPAAVKACYTIEDANRAHERKVMSRNKQRTDTENTDLKYVPRSRAASRGAKDPFPLDFYGGGGSPERYPKVRPQMPYSGPSSIPSRKPVPQSLDLANTAPQYAMSQPRYQRNHQMVTPPSSSPHDTQAFPQFGPVTYPAIPTSQSQGIFTQSFPAPTIGNSRETNAGARDDQQIGQAKSTDPAEDYISLLARHPSCIDYEEAIEWSPCATRTTTPSPPKKSATTNALPTLESLNIPLNKPVPALPQPDFIAPRPALKQRYVSAGGTAKLSDRAEIPGPAFVLPPTLSLTQNSGAAISKHEVDAKMSDPQWVCENFGEEALGLCQTGSLTPPRRSQESKKSHSRNGSNGSDEGYRVSVDKRDRTSSGASANGRVAKLKRVFSRKNSQSEGD